MMCWEVMNDLQEKEPHKEQEKVEKKPIEKTEKPKHEEEHVEPTLNIGNRLKILIEEFSWEREDDGSTLDMQETEQQELVYITNLKNGLQEDSTKLYNEEGPNDKKPAAQNRLIEEPTLNNLNHVYGLCKESGSDNDNIEDSVKGENKKNLKEKDYTSIDEKKEGKRADLLIKEKPQYLHDIPRKKGEMRTLLSPRKWHCQTLGKTFL